MDGGIFIISNGGVFGLFFGIFIINFFQFVILGMYGIFDRLVVVGGKVEVWFMMYVVLIYDYWLIDGREVVIFFCKIKVVVEDFRVFFLDFQEEFIYFIN